MKKLLILILLLPLLFVGRQVYSDDCDTSSVSNLNESQVKEMIGKCQKNWEMIVNAKKPHEESLRQMEKQLAAFQARLNTIASDLKQKEIKINEGDALLGKQEEILAHRVRQFYIKSFYNTPLLLIFSENKSNVEDVVRVLAYQQATTNDDKKTIIKIALYIKNLEDKKKQLETEKNQLSSLQTNVSEQAGKVKKLLTEANAYQVKLEGQISQLSARQEQLLAEKYAGSNYPMSVGETEPSRPVDDRTIDPGFRPAFDFFTFGYPHRVGMSQFGAFGRAKAGQNAETILKAYYNNVRIEKRDNLMGNINVNGYGSKSFEDEYLKGIGEVPSIWAEKGGYEALKVQAIAARSYAVSYTNNGQGSICTTQECQVYIGHNKGGDWERAVNDTRGVVIVSNDTNEVIKAWYASTAGGYTRTSADVWGRSTPFTKRLADLDGAGKAYEGPSYGDSPWFYVAWGSRSEYGNSAWLKSEEVADITNALMLYKADGGTLIHLSQPDKSNGDTWSSDRVKEELRNRGKNPYNSVSDVDTSSWRNGNGITSTVIIHGDAGDNTFDGGDYKYVFNIRAPANVHLKTALYNVEKK
ncbi:MAG: SpoIID/LytB domain protein [Candidatus Gottesmanbacteria bacterium GW2011_GWC2_39_8]|uniref:SpoIID/LytB domain protein n=1 Tax=Candidatus Gottesmanbacteria bacterium GW2011_GWC2_39_8 TaxID=1618450 RepID=A0A0G0T7B1_9BACT|nr:MAG: SpoIID/LytB domain protein [Candidatus Gottesmanbacteria bacterium GW2011_GWC2_39_8]